MTALSVSLDVLGETNLGQAAACPGWDAHPGRSPRVAAAGVLRGYQLPGFSSSASRAKWLDAMSPPEAESGFCNLVLWVRKFDVAHRRAEEANSSQVH